MNSLRILGNASRRLLHGSVRLNSRVPGTEAVGAANGGKGDKEETVAIPASRVLNYPSAEPYLHLRKGRKSIICINEEEVIAAKRKLPWYFKTSFSAETGRWNPPKYRARARRNLRKRTRMAGKEWPWDIPNKKMVRIVPFKGLKRWRESDKRFQNIVLQMEKMPEKIKEYRETRHKNVSLRVANKKKHESFVESIRARIEEAKMRRKK
ncbi:hypothetical protein NDN08_003411 [Rhodosorus marinus]|uniref:MRPL25 domain-containing protein n=1 Tax=Rhodosorus marinus TaxID=101924 RepID=A0AAV8V118_9RHOD|nr:hypothetical protein NDN08_003411 [Rhodosorus marinus]